MKVSGVTEHNIASSVPGYHFLNFKSNQNIDGYLVGGFNPFEKYYSNCHSHADRSGENASLAPSVTRELG